jgi:hypothetical protein
LGSDITSEAGRAAWPTVACGTRIRESGTESTLGLDVTYSVVSSRADALVDGELSLKELATSPNGPGRVAGDEVERCIGLSDGAAAIGDLFSQGQSNSFIGSIRRLGSVDELGPAKSRAQPEDDDRKQKP